LTPGDSLNALFISPLYAGELPDFRGVEFGETAIRGDTALVRFTIDGNMEEIELVQENGNWKIVGNGMEIL
ncbi:MAG: hypothetical protein KAH54_09665, partial [Candidatus Sabulitectum sp.]|nr:hypothetical protein [Candidatus Sabulitectum sp.]